MSLFSSTPETRYGGIRPLGWHDTLKAKHFVCLGHQRWVRISPHHYMIGLTMQTIKRLYNLNIGDFGEEIDEKSGLTSPLPHLPTPPASPFYARDDRRSHSSHTCATYTYPVYPTAPPAAPLSILIDDEEDNGA